MQDGRTQGLTALQRPISDFNVQVIFLFLTILKKLEILQRKLKVIQKNGVKSLVCLIYHTED